MLSLKWDKTTFIKLGFCYLERIKMTWALDLAKKLHSGDNPPPLFGIILYTDAHPNIKKVLRDDDYWKALDEISGPKWAIFSVRARKRYIDLPPEGVHHMMVPVWKEPSANRELLEVFELKDTSGLPVLVIFTFDGENLYRTIVKINESDPNAAFASIKSEVQKVSDALEGLDPESLLQAKVVYYAVNKALNGNKYQKARITKIYSIIKELRDWLPYLKFMFD
jgi:hypothetical protein